MYVRVCRAGSSGADGQCRQDRHRTTSGKYIDGKILLRVCLFVVSISKTLSFCYYLSF